MLSQPFIGIPLGIGLAIYCEGSVQCITQEIELWTETLSSLI